MSINSSFQLIKYVGNELREMLLRGEVKIIETMIEISERNENNLEQTIYEIVRLHAINIEVNFKRHVNLMKIKSMRQNSITFNKIRVENRRLAYGITNIH